MNTPRGRIAFAVCGSFCTLGTATAQAGRLVRQGWELLPVMSFAASRLDTRFGTAAEWKARLEELTGNPVLDTLQAVEPLGPKRLAEALVIAPCTGTTLARLAVGLSDTPVTLAAKSLLRVGCPVLIAVSTNDGLGTSGENIARLRQHQPGVRVNDAVSFGGRQGRGRRRVGRKGRQQAQQGRAQHGDLFFHLVYSVVPLICFSIPHFAPPEKRNAPLHAPILSRSRGWICRPARAASSAAGSRAKSAFRLCGFAAGSSCP